MILLALVVLVVAATATVVRVRPGARPVMEGALPWDLADAARRQITILSGQAAVAVTALVLLVTLVRDQAGVASGPFNTVVVMVLIAFLSFVGAAIQFVNVPLEGGPEGGSIPRWLYLLASFQHYRTLFLAWLALKPLVDTFGLHQPALLLSWVLGSAALAAWLVVASVAYRLGVVGLRDAFAGPAVGLVVMLLAGGALRAGSLARSADAADAVLALTLGLFALNVAAFTFNALAPIASRTSRGASLLDRFAPVYLLADLQASVAILALIWLMLL